MAPQTILLPHSLGNLALFTEPFLESPFQGGNWGLSNLTLALIGLLGLVFTIWIFVQVRSSRRRQWATDVACAIRARDLHELKGLSRPSYVQRWGPGLGDVLAEFEDLLSSVEEGKRRFCDRDRLMRARMEQGATASLVLDAASRILSASDEACWLFSRTRKALVGRTLEQLVEPAEPIPRRYLRILDSIGGSASKRLFRTRPEQGEPLNLLTLSHEIEDPTGKEPETHISFIDLTAFEDREPRLAGAARTVERFAGEIANEFNDRLTAILGHAAILAESSNRNGAQTAGSRIVDEVLHARDHTRQLLAFSRRRVRQQHTANLNDALEEGRAHLTQLLGGQIALELRLDAEEGCVPCPDAKLRGVIEHLVRDAAAALSGTGRVRIETSEMESETDPGSAAIMLRVSAHGAGASEGQASPAQRPDLQRAGRLLEGDSGRLSIEAIRDGGRVDPGQVDGAREDLPRSSVSILWPAVSVGPEKPAAAQPTVEPAPRVATMGPATVCVVEDDEAVLSLVGSILRGAGYRVLEATGGLQAIDLFRDSQETIDLLIVDVEMRPMNGTDLVNTLQRRHGAINTLYMSGSYDQEVFESEITGEVQFLQKPFSPSEIRTLVEQALNTRRRGSAARVVYLESAPGGRQDRLLAGLELEATRAANGAELLDLLERNELDVLVHVASSSTQEDLDTVRWIRVQHPAVAVLDLDLLATERMDHGAEQESGDWSLEDSQVFEQAIEMAIEQAIACFSTPAEFGRRRAA